LVFRNRKKTATAFGLTVSPTPILIPLADEVIE